MTARLSIIGGQPVVGVVGEIDLATLPQLHNVLTRAVHEHLGGMIVVDLDGVHVCDDAGLGVLLGAAGRAREAGGELVVVCTDGPLRNRLARTGFDRAITVNESVASVVSS